MTKEIEAILIEAAYLRGKEEWYDEWRNNKKYSITSLAWLFFLGLFVGILATAILYTFMHNLYN